jgi:hypothetical protein
MANFENSNKKIVIAILGWVFLLSATSCKEDVIPKPASYLRLDYPEANYANFENNCPFTFEINTDGY